MHDASSNPVWFPDRPLNLVPDDGEHVVYHLCGELPRVDPEEDIAHLYVGVTSHFRQRMRAHSRKWWWPLVRLDLCELLLYDTRSEAEAAEADLIRWYQPQVNRAGRLLVVSG